MLELYSLSCKERHYCIAAPVVSGEEPPLNCAVQSACSCTVTECLRLYLVLSLHTLLYSQCCIVSVCCGVVGMSGVANLEVTAERPRNLSQTKRNNSYWLALENPVLPSSLSCTTSSLPPSLLLLLPRFPILTTHNLHSISSHPPPLNKCKWGILYKPLKCLP